MAAAKTDFRTKYGQWVHDKKLVESRRSLAGKADLATSTGSTPTSPSMTSRVDYLAAEDKLITYGIPEEEIEALQVEHLATRPRRRPPGNGPVDQGHDGESAEDLQAHHPRPRSTA